MLSLYGHDLVDEVVREDKTFKVSSVDGNNQLTVFSGRGPKLFKVGNCEIVVTPN